MTDAEVFFKELMQYLYNIDENGRIYLRCQSDSTAIFLVKMIEMLKVLDCTDIQSKGHPAPADKIPKDKPWCSWIDEVNGILPEQYRKCFKRRGV
jgi:hypothetical protein